MISIAVKSFRLISVLLIYIDAIKKMRIYIVFIYLLLYGKKQKHSIIKSKDRCNDQEK